MSLTRIRRLVEAAVAEPPAQLLEKAELQGQHLLLVDDGSPLVDALVEVLRRSGAWVIILQSQPWQRKAPTVQLEATAAPEAVEAVVQRIQQVSNGLQGILLVHTTRIPLDQKWWAETQQKILTAIAVARAISLNPDVPPHFLYFVTAQGGRFALQGDAPVDALATGLEGLIHPLRMEMTKTSFRSIDLDPATPLLDQAQQVVLEMAQPDQPFRTVYGWQNGERAALSIREIASASAALPFTEDAVVVFAGGARGIGAICATALARNVPCRIVFLGRTALTPEIYALSDLSEAERKVKGDEMMRAYKAEHPGCSPREPRDWWRTYLRAVEAVDTLKRLQALGAVIEYHAVDVRDHSAVTQILRTIRDRYQRLDVVVHVAGLGGVETDRMLSRKEWSVIRSVVETKVAGAINLLQAAEAAQASLFVGFGSIASRFGNSGQVDYAAANALLMGLVRAHNARGVLPVARVIAWGAWDGVGMAVSGATKDVLQAHGVEFIHPEQGGLSFVGELGPTLSPTSPAEVYISPNWAGLDELLQREASLLSSVAADTDARSLLGEVTQHTPGVSLRAEHWLQAKEIPFLDHHRYDGTAWVPAVMGMEVAVEGAARLCPQQQPFALRNIRLKKAVRLVRDEPVLLITEVKAEEATAQETQVQATVSAQYKDRTWVFAEMQVILSGDPEVIQQGLDDRHHHHPQTPLALESGELIHWTQEQLYPCEWLRFQTYGSTFQVLQDLHLNCQVGRTEGQMVTTADLSGCLLPLTLIDGVFQAYGIAICTLLQAWSGPPLFIGEIRWLPGSHLIHRANFLIRFNLEDSAHFPILHMVDAEGRCFLRMQGADQGGTGLKQLMDRMVTTASEGPMTGGAAQEKRLEMLHRLPYVGTVLEEKLGQWLKAQYLLQPQREVMLQDHCFHGIVIVPAVYFLEMAVEASAYLLGEDPGPIELRDFHIGQMLTLVKDPRLVFIEVQQLSGLQSRVQIYTESGAKHRRLHAEGVVVHGQPLDIEQKQHPLLQNVQSRPRAGLYPHRFPNGPVFQVIEKMDLGMGHVARAQLSLTSSPPEYGYLPMTLLDGAFQVESATRSGFDHYSGLPKTFTSLRWKPGVAQLESVLCWATTQNGSTECLGELWFVDSNQRTHLYLEGLTLTSQVPRL